MNKVTIIDHVGKKAGMDYYSSSLAKGMLSQGFEPTVYSNFVGIEEGKINYKPYFDGHSKGSTLVKLYHLVRAILKASTEAKRYKSKLVIVHLFSANIVTLLLVAIPKIFSLKTAVISHDVSSFIDNDNRLIKWLIYNLLADHIVVHNNFSYKELTESIEIKNTKKIAIIKQGGYLDLVIKNPNIDIMKHELKLKKDIRYILFFGQIKKVKGLDILLESMTRVANDVHLIIAGKPWKDDFSRYDDLIRKYGLQGRVHKRVKFISDVERDKLFFCANVIVLPYLKIYQSAVLLMAMSYGLPIIASDLEANKEVIDNNNGLLFKTGDSISLSNKINSFFTDESIGRELSYAAIQTIKLEYDWRKIAQQYISLDNKIKNL
jgi:D-inositol-3-phosphate glycosyltransferase